MHKASKRPANAYHPEAQCTLLVVQHAQTTPLNNQENMPTNKGYRLSNSLEMPPITKSTKCHKCFVYVIRQNGVSTDAPEAIPREFPYVQGCKGGSPYLLKTFACLVKLTS